MSEYLCGAHLETALDLDVRDFRVYQISEDIILTTVHFQDVGLVW
jgi:hypothetical protein